MKTILIAVKNLQQRLKRKKVLQLKQDRMQHADMIVVKFHPIVFNE